MRNQKKWREAYEAVMERLNRENENVDPDKRPILFELTIKLYPTIIWMLDPDDKCSSCRPTWGHIDGAMSHAHGLPHFYQWCIEHVDRVRTRFPEVIDLVADATLTENVEVTR